MKLEWLTIREFARELGVSSNVVRSAISRHKLLQAGAYWGESWTLYARNTVGIGVSLLCASLIQGYGSKPARSLSDIYRLMEGNYEL